MTSSGWPGRGRTSADHPPVPEHHDAVGQPEHLVDVVGDQQDVGPLQRAGWGEPLDLGGLGDAEGRGGLVQDEQLRLLAHRPRDRQSWRCPPDSDADARVVSSSGIPRARSMPAAAARVEPRVGEQEPRRSRPSRMFAAMSRLSQSARSCQTTATPRRSDRRRVGGTGCWSSEDLPGGRCQVTGNAAHERGLARPVLTGQRHELARPEAQVDVGRAPAAARTGRRAPGRTAVAGIPSAPVARHLRPLRHCGAFPGHPARGTGRARPAGWPRAATAAG